MTRLLTFLKHFLAVVLPLAVAGASAYADSSGFRHYTDAHPALAAYVPIFAGVLKGVHGILPPSPYSIRIVKRVTTDIDAASKAITEPASALSQVILTEAKPAEQDASLTAPPPAPEPPAAIKPAEPTFSQP